MQQQTIYIGAMPIRQYSHNDRYANVNPMGQVFGFPDGYSEEVGVSDFQSLEHRSTNGANELAIAYVLMNDDIS